MARSAAFFFDWAAMHIDEIRTYCLGKPQVEEETPFGPDTLVFKVLGKIFLLTGLDQIEELSFNVKCDPVRAEELRERYPRTVFPGYHMNKKHWNTVFAHRELQEADLYALIDHSYQQVVQGLPKKQRDKLR